MENKIDLERFPNSASAKRQLSYVSDGFYDESYVGKWLFEVIGIEYDTARELLEDLPNQFIPETATWGLRYHEGKWNLRARENLTYKERRRRIFQKRDFRAPMIPYRMETYLKEATGIDVRVADIHDLGNFNFSPSHPNVFKIFFLAKQNDLDFKTARDILSKLKQSHTEFIANAYFESELLLKECLQLQRIIFKVKIPFWQLQYLDGGWKLNGIYLLDYRRRNLKISLKFKLGIREKERIANSKIILKKKGGWYLNGIINLNGSKQLNTIYKEEEIE